MGMSENDSEHRYKFMVSGDSISKGVIFDEEKSKYVILEGNYINLLKSKFNGIIQNTARFGNTIIKGVSKLKDDVLRHNPDIVLLEYGGNDCDFNWNEVSNNPNADHKRLGFVVCIRIIGNFIPIKITIISSVLQKDYIWIVPQYVIFEFTDAFNNCIPKSSSILDDPIEFTF